MVQQSIHGASEVRQWIGQSCKVDRPCQGSRWLTKSPANADEAGAGDGEEEPPRLLLFEELAAAGHLLQVVGGAGTGGLLVRQDRETSSKALPQRLATGSLVRVLEQDERRLRYELLIGAGPESGWVSVSIKGRDLLVQVAPEEAAEAVRHCLGLCHSSSAEVRAADAFFQGSSSAVQLCRQCCLPLGEIAYPVKEHSQAFVHGECLAQLMLGESCRQEEAKRKEEAALKQARRADFNIGWTVDQVPDNSVAATKLQCSFPADAKDCWFSLVLDAELRQLHVARTADPAAAVNLEYLSLALQVRRKEGREPLFSLDPVLPEESPAGNADLLQAKHYYPEWLSGTTVGEVLFQADYHLKELSMGEYEQPVAGMRSCFDFYQEDVDEECWTAREWFVVRKAEVYKSEDNVLLPYIKMGVEAREMVSGPDGWEDAPITRKDHPLVRYAEAFTHFFDLIAERKSVIFHLREFAKATILAKFLLDSGLELDPCWFDLAGSRQAPGCLLLPQLWNQSGRARLQAWDETLASRDKVIRKITHSVYGGVSFGLERFTLSGATPEYGARLAMRAPMGRTAPDFVSKLTARVPKVAPRGVDLSLENFSLTEAVQKSVQAGAGSWAAAATEEASAAAAAAAFWRSLYQMPGVPAKEEALTLKDKDRRLLRDIFNPRLSDRRDDGARFVPPDASLVYVNLLRALTSEEDSVRQKRKDHFLSTSFAMDAPGALFPSSWASSCQPGSALPAGAALRPAAEDDQVQALVRHVLETGAPVFDRCTEDGVRYRVYRFGSLEVRTTQMPAGKETPGAVFSVHWEACEPSLGEEEEEVKTVSNFDRIVQATEYVERACAPTAAPPAGAALKRESASHFYHNYFVVFETEAGSFLLTEQLADGSVAWEVDPKGLQGRLALAKTLRSGVCRGGGCSVQEVRQQCIREAQQCFDVLAARRCYAGGAFDFALRGRAAVATLQLHHTPLSESNEDTWAVPSSRTMLASSQEEEKNCFGKLFSGEKVCGRRPLKRR